ncbi:MAG: F0F1 ATP synthase subunit B [Planctomycetaceae bacterium]|nr:F0F1 ATP synthase subunit B [Planctomycetaceae bacterium]
MKKAQRIFSVFAIFFLFMPAFAVSQTCLFAAIPEEGAYTANSDPGEHGKSEHGEGEHGKKVDLNPLEWKTDLEIWSTVIFIGLVLIVGKFGFKPIAKALDDREKRIADNIANAERANQDAKDLLKQYEAKLSDAEGEVRVIVEAGKQEALRAGEAIIAKAREASEAERVRAMKEIEAATDGALQGLAAKSADLAVSLAGKIIREKLDPKSHADLIQTAVADFSKN